MTQPMLDHHGKLQPIPAWIRIWDDKTINMSLLIIQLMQRDVISFRQMLQNQFSIVCLNVWVIYDFLNPQLPFHYVVTLSCSVLLCSGSLVCRCPRGAPPPGHPEFPAHLCSLLRACRLFLAPRAQLCKSWHRFTSSSEL